MAAKKMSQKDRSNNITPSDASAWSSRCWFWQDQIAQNRTSRATRERERQPLILAGHGVSLRIDGGSLLIRNGLTHYPQKSEIHRYFRGSRDLPERIIILDCTGSISFDVMTWLADYGVTLIKINWQGETIILTSPTGYSANRYRVEWQQTTRNDDAKRMIFCNQLIIRKIESSIITLERYIRHTGARENAMRTAYATLTRLDATPARDVIELRGLEGSAAAAYFRAWNDFPMRWRKRSRRPIPPDWLTIGVRSSGYYATGNQNARHPANAILNYAYRILECAVKIWAIAEGYDPSIGIMHEPRPGASSFVFDIMELQRASTDRQILKFVQGTEFDPADFVTRTDGTCRLNPDLARVVARLVTDDCRNAFSPCQAVLGGC